MAKSLMMLVNPAAGRSMSDLNLGTAVSTFALNGYCPTVFYTTAPGTASKIVEENAAQRLLQQRFRDERRRLAHEPVEPLPGVVPADGKFLHCPSASVSSRSIFRSARRRKNAVAHADTTSAIGKHHHTLPTFPVSDRRYAAGMSATT